ncbi:MAG: radical SAM protein [Dethiobacteria bacterium]
MIRVSLGTAACLGLTRMRSEALPTTAYLLHGEGCLMNCAFCPQAREAGGKAGRLGRISWPPFPREEVIAGLQRAAGKGLQRICLQAVCEPGGGSALAGLIRLLSGAAGLPISLSAPVHSVAEAALFFDAGAERISIALDTVSEELSARYKGGGFEKRLRLLRKCARLWPGRMSTHIICGLGETEEEAAQLLELLVREKITVGLFAFTPLKGTPLEGHPPPEPGSYRRLQALYYLLRRGHISWPGLRFRKGRLVSFGIGERELRRLLGGGEAFQTGGCPGCNRPYFNERPGGLIYNYPRPLSAAETAAALAFIREENVP